jgi:hypothetical protein
MNFLAWRVLKTAVIASGTLSAFYVLACGYYYGTKWWMLGGTYTWAQTLLCTREVAKALNCLAQGFREETQQHEEISS